MELYCKLVKLIFKQIRAIALHLNWVIEWSVGVQVPRWWQSERLCRAVSSLWLCVGSESRHLTLLWVLLLMVYYSSKTRWQQSRGSEHVCIHVTQSPNKSVLPRIPRIEMQLLAKPLNSQVYAFLSSSTPNTLLQRVQSNGHCGTIIP